MSYVDYNTLLVNLDGFNLSNYNLDLLSYIGNVSFRKCGNIEISIMILLRRLEI